MTFTAHFKTDDIRRKTKKTNETTAMNEEDNLWQHDADQLGSQTSRNVPRHINVSSVCYSALLINMPCSFQITYEIFELS